MGIRGRLLDNVLVLGRATGELASIDSDGAVLGHDVAIGDLVLEDVVIREVVEHRRVRGELQTDVAEIGLRRHSATGEGGAGTGPGEGHAGEHRECHGSANWIL